MNHAVDIKKRLHNWVSETAATIRAAENKMTNSRIWRAVELTTASVILLILVWLTITSLGSWHGSFQHYPSLPLY
ncbi:MAG: hypothetical protein GY869_11755 [Planctomycetes bacterium]|nr:hypothetical protein [Planctomycetota bacterium]